MGSIPLVDLGAQQSEVADDVAAGWQEILDRSGFVGGPKVAAFESEYADFIGTSHCVGVGNGTDAVEIALRAFGVGPGDECIIPANTFIATAEAVSRAGAVPVPVDCADDDTYLIDAGAVVVEDWERAVARGALVAPAFDRGHRFICGECKLASPGFRRFCAVRPPLD